MASLNKPEPNGAAAAPHGWRKSTGFSESAGFDFGATSASFSEINQTVYAFVKSESDAALAHLKALSQVRSPSELMRLQVGEIQRLADSSLNCLNTLARSAGRLTGAGR